MNYYIDTEFHEYHKQYKCLGIKIGKAIPTIDLISIGIVAEDGREYYAVSEDFNIKDAWNSFQIEKQTQYEKENGFEGKKTYWLRENVLKPIYFDTLRNFENKAFANSRGEYERVTYYQFKEVIKKYGKTNKKIAEEIKDFVNEKSSGTYPIEILGDKTPINFYAYYADYDWVVFAQLFGKMIDLPTGFPMYCKDLKQILDVSAKKYDDDDYSQLDLNGKIEYLKTNSNYPKQENEHNALDDALWNKKLHEFLKKI